MSDEELSYFNNRDEEASFFSIRDKGRSFAYVLDASGSMYGTPLRVAKAELGASLHRLYLATMHRYRAVVVLPKLEYRKAQSKAIRMAHALHISYREAMALISARCPEVKTNAPPTAPQFQVIFYNETVHEMKFVGPFGDKMFDRSYRVFRRNMERAVAFADGIVADGAADHLRALRRALRQSPDVLFFLTASNSRVNASQLQLIRTQYNTDRTHIHCIEFGKGPRLQNAPDNFLQKLARQNHGEYCYRDVTRFGR